MPPPELRIYRSCKNEQMAKLQELAEKLGQTPMQAYRNYRQLGNSQGILPWMRYISDCVVTDRLPGDKEEDYTIFIPYDLAYTILRLHAAGSCKVIIGERPILSAIAG